MLVTPDVIAAIINNIKYDLCGDIKYHMKEGSFVLRKLLFIMLIIGLCIELFYHTIMLKAMLSCVLFSRAA